MEIGRRHFLELLAGAGVSVAASSWLVDRVLALASEGELPVAPGPGIESWIPTTCSLCQGGCGLEVRRIDGLPVGVRGLAQHPINRGKLCPLPHAAIQMLLSPDRVRKPLKRAGRRGQGLWAEISWDDAETIIVERLQTLIGAGSRGRVAFLDARAPGLGRAVAAAFMRGVGSPHFIAPVEPRADALASRMFGWNRFPGADLAQSRVVLLFRFDHLETDGSPVWQSRIFAEARDRTTDRPVYIAVGPRLLGSAAKCDRWLPARPGTEGIVAVAMAHVILENQWENRDFLGRSTDWVERVASGKHGLHRLLATMTPAVASEITGVPAQLIEEGARRFVRHQPGVALVGPGTLTSPSGMMTLVAVNLLNLLVGAVGKPGTLVEVPEPSLGRVCEPTADGPHLPQEGEAITTPPQLARALSENEPTPIDLLFIRQANPTFDSPLAHTIKRGLASYDRTVVSFATELDETAMMADLVLPEPTFLERWDLQTAIPVVPRGLALLQQPAIEPLFSSRQSEETLVRVNNALGKLSRVVFPDTTAEALTQRASRGLLADERGAVADLTAASKSASHVANSWEALLAATVWSFADAHQRPAPPAQRIATLPGRLLGLPSEPSVTRLRDLVSPRSLGDPDRYPYLLFTFRTAQLHDGATTNVPMMMEQAGHWAETMWVTWAEIHPRTAAEAHVAHGNVIRIVSELGHIRAVARVSEATPPGVVTVPVGFGHDYGSTAAGVGANVNLIFAPGLTDPAWERSTRVNVVGT